MKPKNLSQLVRQLRESSDRQRQLDLEYQHQRQRLARLGDNITLAFVCLTVLASAALVVWLYSLYGPTR